ncbi:MAG TPA: tetratricopeptide repeat protein, partial [Chthoniobacterales bacterium]|nr:tetratricopeptide repeat protein [Chthoniobacterales bacterium]
MESKPFRQGVPSLLARTLEISASLVRRFGLVLVLCWFAPRMEAEGPKPTSSPGGRTVDQANRSASPSPTPAEPVSRATPLASATPAPSVTPQSNAFTEAFRRGWEAANQQRYHDAISAYTEALSFKPSDFDVYNDRGVVYLALREYNAAIVDFTEAIRLKPDFAEAFNDRGDAYGAQQQHDQAIADYTEAVRLKPAFVEAYYNRA